MEKVFYFLCCIGSSAELPPVRGNSAYINDDSALYPTSAETPLTGSFLRIGLKRGHIS